ncbi:hypothetical protein ACGFX7_16770 [Streptomyces harbinensis]|uniref:hypothetical protein n=1 Tax=Streptomyces harbinensis TaxID=1176198 RepID=UPI0037150836
MADHQAVRAAVSYQNLLHDQEQRRTELSRRLEEARVLQATLMKDPSLAVAYWFAVAPQSLDADTLDRLEGLFAKVAAYAPQGTWAPLARLLHDFTERLTDEAKSHLIATLGAIADRYGQPEIAEEIHALQDNSSDTFPSQ